MIKLTQPQMLQELIQGLTQAEGAAGQIIHQHQDPRWILIRDTLSGAKELCFSMATFDARKVFITGQ